MMKAARAVKASKAATSSKAAKASKAATASGPSAAAAGRPARRATGVSLGQRVARALCGSPSVRRAVGGTRTSFRPQALRTAGWRERRCAVPVFEVDRRGPAAAERLPRLWVTEPAFDPQSGERAGRAYVGAYPTDPDRGGWRAFELASRYFAEGLGGCGAEGAEADQHRTDCFRAAEVLYLHSARRGNLKAWVKLGTIYAFDMAEGRYWQGLLESRAAHCFVEPARKAFACFSRAALAGDAEGCWQLGDLLAAGRGCARDDRRAFTLYTRALLHGANAEQQGLAALRLARCFEGARGCSLDLGKAQALYRWAAERLQEAFGDGQWHCKRELHEARTGAARMAQELHGGY